jgi:AcrR family transcriptional regulator
MPRMPKSRLSPRKSPSQARSQATVEAILQAATRVLTQHSLAGFNTNRVAEVAGVSVGSLYQYFPNKDALVTALITQTQHGLLESVQQLVDDLREKSLDAKLRAMCQFAIDQQYQHPKLAAALDHEERRLPLQKLLGETQNRLGMLAHELLSPDLPGITGQEIADCFAVMKALVEMDSDGREPPSDLHERLLRAVKGYLLSRAR